MKLSTNSRRGAIISTEKTLQGYAAAAPEYRSNGFAPFPVIGKGRQDDGSGGLPKGATGRDGQVTDFKIIEWSSSEFWRGQNIALRAEGFIAIDVDVYGDKRGDQTMASLEAQLGVLPATITSTRREPFLPDGSENPSRQHFYRVPADTRFVTRFTDVEIIQHGHRYSVVWPSVVDGMTYTWYDYDGEPLGRIPSPDDFEELPEAWLQALAAPESTAGGEGFAGSLGEWVEKLPEVEPSALMREWITSIPAEDFGHDVLISLQASLVNLATTYEPGVRQALFALRAAWLRGPYDTPDYARDFDVSLEGAIKKFGAFPDKASDILEQDQLSIVNRISNPGFTDIWIKPPSVEIEESLRERVAYVMSLAYSNGLSLLEAATLGWHSSAAQRPLGFRSTLPLEEALQYVWDLALEVAANPVNEERDFLADLPVVEPEPESPALLPGRAVKLLDDAESARVVGVNWWGRQFMQIMRELNDPINEQYFHLSQWMILSLAFAPVAHLVRRNGTRIIFNFYGMLIGPTNTGKTESFEIVHQVMKIVDPMGGWDIGGKTSSAGLAEALIQRHMEGGGATILHPDEADATIRSWKEERGPFADMKNTITDIYTGRVPKHQLTTRKDSSGVDAKAYLNVLLTGVPEKVADQIEPDDWISGFINRFVWAEGVRSPVTDDQLVPDFLEEGEDAEHSEVGKWVTQWGNLFGRIQGSLLREGGMPRVVTVDEDVRLRHAELKKQFKRIAASDKPYEERLLGTFNRLEVTILKCAALVALSDGRLRVSMDDWLIAAEQGEEWVTNIMKMIKLTNKTARARAVDKLAALVASNGGRMPMSAVHRADEYQGDSWGTGNLVKELVAQRRAEILPLSRQGGEDVVSLLGGAA